MDIKYTKQHLFPPIKVLSIVLMTSAIALELWHIQAVINNTNIPSILNPVFLIERFAIAAHLVEAVIAAYYAPSREKTPIKYATYTFFVGTVGLLELFDREQD